MTTVFKSSGKTFVTTLLIAVGGFISSVITARALGSDGRGLLSAALLIGILAATFAQMGLSSSFVYYLGAACPFNYYRMYWASLIAVSLLAALSAVAGIQFSHDASIHQHWILIATYALFMSGYTYFSSICQVQSDLNYMSFMRMAMVAGNLMFVVFLVLLYKSVDYQSTLIAQEFTDHVYQAPDMAHHLYPIINDPRAAVHDALLHSRVDQEQSDLGDLSEFNIATTTDWPQLLGQRQRTIGRLAFMGRRLNKLHAAKLYHALMWPYWRNYSAVLIRDAVRLFAQQRQIVTNRLHGHILACLLDKPNMVLDNIYGKNSRYIHAWIHSSPLLTLRPSATPDERVQ